MNICHYHNFGSAGRDKPFSLVSMAFFGEIRAENLARRAIEVCLAQQHLQDVLRMTSSAYLVFTTVFSLRTHNEIHYFGFARLAFFLCCPIRGFARSFGLHHICSRLVLRLLLHLPRVRHLQQLEAGWVALLLVVLENEVEV